MGRPRNYLKLLPAVIALLSLAMPCAGDVPSQEYKVKAAFIFNFARFIDWPAGVFASDDAPFVIAVVGADPFNGALEQAVTGKKIGGHPVEVRHFNSVETIGPCQILFVPSADDDTQGRILQKVQSSHVLTVGESDNFTSSGGSLRFFTEDNKMRFEVNTDATDRANLKVSSKLLKLARIFKR